jgi:hypothetical protein
VLKFGTRAIFTQIMCRKTEEIGIPTRLSRAIQITAHIITKKM